MITTVYDPKGMLDALFRIRIWRIRKFLGPPPDPLLRGTDLNLDPSIMKQIL